MEERISELKFPIASEYTFVAVSNPKLTGIYSFFKSPSIVFGAPITLHFEPCFSKYSARRHAFVLESSPPITTRPSRSRAFAFASEASNCSGFSILCLPDPNKALIRFPRTLTDHIKASCVPIEGHEFWSDFLVVV